MQRKYYKCTPQGICKTQMKNPACVLKDMKAELLRGEKSLPHASMNVMQFQLKSQGDSLRNVNKLRTSPSIYYKDKWLNRGKS